MNKRAATLAAVAVFGLMAGVARADSIVSPAGVGLNGTIGGNGGYHTITIDGVSCTFRNSTQGGPSSGCNYTLTGGVDAFGKGSLKLGGNCAASCQ
jgi:microcompartment protein CcmL/EutN